MSANNAGPPGILIIGVLIPVGPGVRRCRPERGIFKEVPRGLRRGAVAGSAVVGAAMTGGGENWKFQPWDWIGGLIMLFMAEYGAEGMAGGEFDGTGRG
jgi:hypothetical protein